MPKKERMDAIMRLLAEDHASSIQDLARVLDVSQMTIRRDLVTLSEEEKVRVLYGSVMLHPSVGQRPVDGHYSLNAAGAERREEKRRIGLFAASLIEPEDSLIIDCGSTTEYVAKSLPEDRSFTVLSFALNIIAESVRRGNCRSVVAGGVFHENTLMFESQEGLAAIRGFRASKAFISASGIDAELGVTCSNAYERETKKAVMASAMRKILVADSSKFGVVRSVYFADLAEFDEVITDTGLAPAVADLLRSRGIRLTLV